MTAKCYIVLPRYIDFKEMPNVPYETKTLKEAVQYKAALATPEVYNIWDIETGQLVLGTHPVTGEVIQLPTKGALE